MAGRPGRSGGHNKLPLSIHALRGTRPHTTKPPRPAIDLPAATKPDTLTPAASAAWGRLAPLALQLGTLTAADTIAFSLLCECVSTMEQILANKHEHFDPVVARAERDVIKTLLTLLDQFGFSPTSRARLVPPAPAASKPVNKWEGLLA